MLGRILLHTRYEQWVFLAWACTAARLGNIFCGHPIILAVVIMSTIFANELRTHAGSSIFGFSRILIFRTRSFIREAIMQMRYEQLVSLAWAVNAVRCGDIFWCHSILLVLGIISILYADEARYVLLCIRDSYCYSLWKRGASSSPWQQSALPHYFCIDYREGREIHEEKLAAAGYEFLEEARFGPVFRHVATGIIVWSEALDLTGNIDAPCEVVFHYTSCQGFCSIIDPHNGAVVLRATLMTQKGASGVPDAFYGSGVYATRRDPDWFQSIVPILYNNYYGAILKKTSKEIEERTPFTKFVIPLLVRPDQFTDVKVSVTQELRALGITEPGVDRHGNKMFEADKLTGHLQRMPPWYKEELKHLFSHGRDVIVVQIDTNDGIANAQGSVVEIKRRRLARFHHDFGALAWKTLHAKARLAVGLHAHGDFKCATKMLQETLEAQSRTFGPERQDTLITKGCLANALQATGDLKGAMKLLQEVLEAQSRTLGPEHFDTLSTQFHFANSLSITGDLKGAMKLRQEALEAQSRNLGPEHVMTLTTKGFLAKSLHDTGDFKGAMKLLQEALEAQSRTLGPEHVSTLKTRATLGKFLHATGDFKGAMMLRQEVLEAQSRTLGPEHPDTLITKADFAKSLHAIGDVKGAMKLLQEVLEAEIRTLGPEHPETLITEANLANSLHDTGDLKGAMKLLQEVLEAQSRTLGAEHVDTLTTKANLAISLHATGDFKGAMKLLQEVLEAQSRTLGPEHAYTLTTKANLASCLHATGDLKGAMKLRQEALEAQKPHPWA